MYGAILGDIVGSSYEFDCNNYKAKDFPLFSRQGIFAAFSTVKSSFGYTTLTSVG